MGPGKETDDQLSKDQVWRQLDRQEWICTSGKAFGQVGRETALLRCFVLFCFVFLIASRLLTQIIFCSEGLCMLF